MNNTEPHRTTANGTLGLPLTLRGIAQIARVTGLSHHTVRAAIHDGALPRISPDGARPIVCRTSDVLAWVDRGLEPEVVAS